MLVHTRAPEGRPPKALWTLLQSFTTTLDRRLNAEGTLQFRDLVKYADDPVGFMHEIIGCTTWDKQREMLEAACKHDRVSVRASQKASKDHSAAALALWWLCTRIEARVIFTAPTMRQTQQVLYRQIKQHIAAIQKRHPGLLDCLRVAELCETGIQTRDYTDLRSINGFVSHDTGGVQGISAPTGKLLIIIDEASHVDDEIYTALEANLAAGGKMFVISNPLRSHGWFYQSHTKNREFWHCIQISALMNPNYQQRRTVIPGLASYEYVERKRREWGEDSAAFITRILGEFPLGDSARMFPFDRVQEACDRWEDAPAEGPLHIGLDPAGASERADEIAAAFVRGKKLLDLQCTRSLDAQQLVDWLIAVTHRWRQSGEVPELRLDVEGSVGAEVIGTLRAHERQSPGSFRLVPLASSDNARRNKKAFGTLRDELADGCEQWVKTGALIDDPLLLEDLAVMEWRADIKGRNRLIPKRELISILGRSPDRYDALCLATYSSSSAATKAAVQAQAERKQAQPRQGSPDRQWRKPSGRDWYARR